MTHFFKAQQKVPAGQVLRDIEDMGQQITKPIQKLSINSNAES